MDYLHLTERLIKYWNGFGIITSYFYIIYCLWYMLLFHLYIANFLIIGKPDKIPSIRNPKLTVEPSRPGTDLNGGTGGSSSVPGTNPNKQIKLGMFWFIIVYYGNLFVFVFVCICILFSLLIYTISSLHVFVQEYSLFSFSFFYDFSFSFSEIRFL